MNRALQKAAMARMHVLVLLWGCLAAGCIIDTVPMPEEQPTIDTPPDDAGGRQPGLINSYAIYYSSDPVLLAGAEGAVGGAGTVIVDNPARQSWRGQILSAPNGSFALAINAQVGDEIQLSFAVGGIIVATETLRIEAGSVEAVAATPSFAAGDANGGTATPPPSVLLTATPPDGQGRTTVSAPANSFTFGLTVVVANIDGGCATAVSVQSDGSFVASLPATSGDRVQVFAVESASSNGGGSPVMMVVP